MLLFGWLCFHVFHNGWVYVVTMPKKIKKMKERRNVLSHLNKLTKSFLFFTLYVHITKTTTTKVFIYFNVENACGHDLGLTLVLTSALNYVNFNGIGLPFEHYFLQIPPKPTVIHPLSIKFYSKTFRSPLSALQTLLSALRSHTWVFPIRLLIIVVN
jgi:hypothetical protein